MAGGLSARDGTILTVCTGNVCRSPYIEKLLSAGLKDTDITVSSAGTGALVGSDMDARVAARLAKHGLNPEGFVARQLTPEMARSADLILAATREHRALVVRMEPSVLRRTYALADFSDLASHLLDTRTFVAQRSTDSLDSYVRRVSEAAARGRGEVRTRTRGEAEIVDPFRASEKRLERMIEQIESLLPAIISIFV